MKNIEAWKSRYTVKQFTNKSIDPVDIEYLVEIFEYIPIQNGVLSHMWIRLGPDDQDFKTFLYENIFLYGNKSSLEHMYPVASAPYVFLGLYHKRNLVGKNVTEHEKVLNIGLHGGVLLTEALHLGYDVSQVACNDGFRFNRKEKQKEFNRLVVNSMEKQELEKYIDEPKKIHLADYFPKLAICIGKGLPLSKENNTVMLDGKPAKIHQKIKKPSTNLVIRKRVND